MNFSQHGGNLREYQRTYGPQKPVIDFSSGLNPLGAPSALSAPIQDAAAKLELMPDLKARALKSEISGHFPVFPENILIEQSVQSLFLLALRALKPRRVLLVEPCLADYRKILNLEGIEVISFALKESEMFDAVEKKLLNAIQNVDMLIIANPNNPTGRAYDREGFKEIIEEAHRRDIFVIIDEYYSDWAMQYSLAKQVQDNCYFFVMKSFSSFYAVPGLRLAYGLGARKFVERMQIRQFSPACDLLSESFAIQILRDGLYREETSSWYQKEKPWFLDQLNRINGLRVYPSETINFLAKIKGNINAKVLLEYLAEDGYLLRGCNDYSGLDHSYFRISMRERDENEKLIAALTGWFEKNHSALTVSL